MNKILFYPKLILNIIIRYKITILVSLLVGIALFFIINIVFSNTYFLHTKYFGYVGLYRADELPQELSEKISFGLVSFDDNMVPIPSAARSWETPDNGKTWIFILRDDLYWQDETAFSANDITFNFSDVKFEVIDNLTISFSLENTFSPFPSIMRKPLYKSSLVGLGQWKVDNITFSGGYVETVTIQNIENKRKEVYKFYPTADSAKTAFKLGKIDHLIGIYDYFPFGEWKGIQVETVVNKNQSIVLFFNINNNFLNDKNIRQSFSYAIDKTYFENRSFSPISPLSWAYNPQVKKYDTDINRAKELFAEIPEEMNIDEYVFKIVSSSTLLPLAEKISEDLEKISVKSEILVSPIIPSEYDLFLTIYDIPEDPDQYSLWHSTQTNSNITKYISPRIDKLLEEGRSVVDINERRRIYFDFQRFLMEDVPAVFLYHPTYYTISR